MGPLGDSRIGLGDRIHLDGRGWTVAGLPGGLVNLVDVMGQQVGRTVFQLVQTPDFEILERGPLSLPSDLAAERQSEDAEQRALWWERHLVEVITGQPAADGVPGPRAQFDPRFHDLAAREAAKARELAAAGVAGASARTVRRKRQRYQLLGRAGLVDGRTVRAPGPGTRTDPRVLECLLTVLSIREGRAAEPMEFYQRRTRELFIDRYGEAQLGVMPSRSTFYRLLNQLSPKHQEAGRPINDGFPSLIAGGTWVSRPGQRVFLQTMRMRVPGGGRWLGVTIALDELTWSVCAVAVDEEGVDADGSALLERWWVAGTEPVGGSACPGTGLGGRVPLILPEFVALDPVGLGRSKPFYEQLRALGVSVLPAAPFSATSGSAKVHLLCELFRHFLLRRDDVSQAPSWTPAMVQEWLEQWVVAVWQRRPLGQLRQIVGFEFDATPNGAFAVCAARRGWVHLPLPGTHRPDRPVRLLDGPGLGQAGERVPPDSSQVLKVPGPPVQPGIRPVAVFSAGPALGPKRAVSLPRPVSASTGNTERLAYHARLLASGNPLSGEVRDWAERLLLLRKQQETGGQALVVTGPARCGKTSALLELAHRHEPDPGFSTVVYACVPPASTARTVLGLLADALCVPRPAGTVALSDAVQEELRAAGTRMVLLDDAHHLASYRERSEPGAWEFLTYLCGQVPALFVYAAHDPGFTMTGTGMSQSGVRATHLRAVPVTDPEVWQTLVDSLEDLLRLRRHQAGSLSFAGPYLLRRTGGWVGPLVHLVRSAAIQAIVDGSERVSMASLLRLP